MVFVAFTAEFWANNKPILMIFRTAAYLCLFHVVFGVSTPSEFHQARFRHVIIEFSNTDWAPSGRAIRWSPRRNRIRKSATFPSTTDSTTIGSEPMIAAATFCSRDSSTAFVTDILFADTRLVFRVFARNAIWRCDGIFRWPHRSVSGKESLKCFDSLP